jgi:hypothetical protein
MTGTHSTKSASCSKNLARFLAFELYPLQTRKASVHFPPTSAFSISVQVSAIPFPISIEDRCITVRITQFATRCCIHRVALVVPPFGLSGASHYQSLQRAS